MKLRLALALITLAVIAGCTGTYSGYRSKCACDFQKMEPVNLEFV